MTLQSIAEVTGTDPEANAGVRRHDGPDTSSKTVTSSPAPFTELLPTTCRR